MVTWWIDYQYYSVAPGMSMVCYSYVAELLYYSVLFGFMIGGTGEVQSSVCKLKW